MHPLDGIIAKLQRADESIGNLNSEINAFIRNNAHQHSIVSHFENEGREYVIEARGSMEVPLRLAVLTGEIVHHLRSMLDHLVTALAGRNGQRPLNNHQFPICRKQEKFIKAVKSGNITGVSPAAEKLISDAQPYIQPSPEEYFLTILHDFDNCDKHSLLLVVAAAAAMGEQVRVGSDEAEAARLGISPHTTLTNLVPGRGKLSQDGVEIARIGLAEPSPTFYANVNIAIQIAFEKAGLAEMIPATDALTILRNATATLIASFSSEF
jgi:hypothetical protein